MLDLQQRVDLPGLPDISVFRDDERPRAFYAWPNQIRVVREGSSKYDVRLVVYGKRTGGRFIPSGAMLALTVGIELTAGEQSALHTALTGLLDAESGSEPPPQPELLHAEWLDGAAELNMEVGGKLTGKPSLYAGNRTVFSVNIREDHIAAFLEAWQQRFAGSAVAFAMRVKSRAGVMPLAFTGRVMPADAAPDDYVTRIEL